MIFSLLFVKKDGVFPYYFFPPVAPKSRIFSLSPPTIPNPIFPAFLPAQALALLGLL